MLDQKVSQYFIQVGKAAAVIFALALASTLAFIAFEIQEDPCRLHEFLSHWSGRMPPRCTVDPQIISLRNENSELAAKLEATVREKDVIQARSTSELKRLRLENEQLSADVEAKAAREAACESNLHVLRQQQTRTECKPTQNKATASSRVCNNQIQLQLRILRAAWRKQKSEIDRLISENIRLRSQLNPNPPSGLWNTPKTNGW